MDTLLKLWPIIISLGTVAGSLGAARYALQVIGSRLDALATELKETNRTLVNVGTSVAVQSATLAAHTEQDRIQFETLRSGISQLHGVVP